MCPYRSRGFTLIEMSVVLVIIGLLAAGIVLAQSLIRTSKVQTIITDVSTFQNAIVQFRQKYSAIPGDMENATSYWGTNPNCATGGAGTGTQTCNGNGDGHIIPSGTPPYEQYLVWQHLAIGGFIPGTYTGAASPLAASGYASDYCAPGVNCPGGQVNQMQSYMLAYSVDGWDGNSTQTFWDLPSGHYLMIGQAPAGKASFPNYPVVTAPEAYMLDSKVDDGLPGMGIWRSGSANGTLTHAYMANCVIDSTSGAALADGTIASQPKGAYNVAYGNSKLACALLVQFNF